MEMKGEPVTSDPKNVHLEILYEMDEPLKWIIKVSTIRV